MNHWYEFIIILHDCKEMSFKDISYLEIWLRFCSSKWKYLCNYGRGYNEQQFCDLFRIKPVVQEMLFKRFLILSSGSPPVQWSGNIYAILKEDIMGNSYVKLYEIWTSGSGGDVIKIKVYGRGTKTNHNTSP